MNAMQRALSAYGQASQTLAPIHQIVMAYDVAIRRIKEARGAIERREVGQRYAAVSKATAIIEALQSALDQQRGGEIARSLDRIYTYVAFRLQRINLTDDVGICDELVARLGELRSSWAELAGRGEPAAMPSGVPVGTPAAAAERARGVTI